MIGAISGDVIGSVHEGAPPMAKDFPLFVPGSRFTDDTVLTVAVAGAIRNGEDFAVSLRRWGRRYPRAGYGGWFRTWLFSEDAGPYNSFGNGSAMRVAAVGWAFDDLDTVLREAARSAEVTHNHPEGIKGAQAIAAAIFLGRTGRGKDAVEALLSERFGYDCTTALKKTLDPIIFATAFPAHRAAFSGKPRRADRLAGRRETVGKLYTLSRACGLRTAKRLN